MGVAISLLLEFWKWKIRRTKPRIMSVWSWKIVLFVVIMNEKRTIFTVFISFVLQNLKIPSFPKTKIIVRHSSHSKQKMYCLHTKLGPFGRGAKVYIHYNKNPNIGHFFSFFFWRETLVTNTFLIVNLHIFFFFLHKRTKPLAIY